MKDLKSLPGAVWGYDSHEIENSKINNSILNCDIEISRKCNLKCKFCYNSSGKNMQDELNVVEIKEVINSAKDLGAKTITLTGGEPLFSPIFFELAQYVVENSIRVLIFTNGTLITKEIALKLKELGVLPCVSIQSLNPEIHDDLVNFKGGHKKVMDGIENLIEAGYTETLPLTINTVLTSITYPGLEDLWKWSVSKKIDPFILRLISTGRSLDNMNLQVSSQMIKELVEKLSSITNYSPDIPFFCNQGCRKHHISIFVSANGFVQPCVGIPINCGNVRIDKLEGIFYRSPIIKMMKNLEENIHGECKHCKHSTKCYGCRALTYSMTGDIAASDPLCWHVSA